VFNSNLSTIQTPPKISAHGRTKDWAAFRKTPVLFYDVKLSDSCFHSEKISSWKKIVIEKQTLREVPELQCTRFHAL